MGFPEYKVPLPGGSGDSQNDIFVIAKSNNQLITMTIKGKASEPFGQLLSEWMENASSGKERRLKFLCEKLGINQNIDISNQCYQLFHRTASALILAEEFNASNAIMLVHSFSKTSERFDC